jgi:hypothetical protein
VNDERHAALAQPLAEPSGWTVVSVLEDETGL